VHHKFVVTDSQVGKPLTWTISNREPGAAIDLWLFSTNPDLLDQYSQEELDQLLLAGAAAPSLTISSSGKTATISWAASETGYILESSAGLAPAAWTVVATTQNSVTVDTSSGTRFYRLRKP